MTALSNALRPWRVMPAVAIVATVIVAVAGLAAAVYSDELYRGQQTREIDSQARILAASVSAALAFDDDRAAQEYVDALKANPEFEAAGVYDSKGRLVARFNRAGAVLPAKVRPSAPFLVEGRLITAVPVTQGDTALGTVYLRGVAEPAARRISRYSAIGFLALMAMLVVAVLGLAQAALRRANTVLARRNEELRVQIEEREKAEEALRQSQKMEAIGQITGGVAHDFNNILMVASSGLDLLERTDDRVRRSRLTDGIRQAVKRGADLTRQLLAFARRSALKPEVIDLGVQMEGMRVLLDRSLREDVTIEIHSAPDLWPVEVDAGQLELAVLNIAVNARDAMPQGGVITIAARNQPSLAEHGLEGDFVRLSVTDQGEGMGPETLARAIEPFFTTKEVGKGTGLGLSQVYGFARSSGGDVTLESPPGHGATVSLYLPRSLCKPATAAASIGEVAEKGRGRVLLVEDDESVGAMVSEMLDELGYEIVRASDAGEALLRLAQGEAVDIVFSDMVMPGEMNGIELAREISRRKPGLPILLTTGFSPAAQAATEEGLPLLSKPYSIEALASALISASRHKAVNA
ncbi:hypothetical protein BH11PSE2_BH11PSE2_09440 [soil metagenome]